MRTSVEGGQQRVQEKEFNAVPTLLISGTDTNVGKTVVTAALVAYGQTYRQSQRIAVCKPLQTGIGDRELYQRLFDLDQAPELLNPLHYQAPLAPPLAAVQEGQLIDLAIAWQAVRTLQQTYDWVFIEALGGLGSPVTHELTVADLARDWHLPTILVVPVKLGAIGQAVAHVALARYMGLPLKGLILSCIQPCTVQELENWAPQDLIQSLTQTPVLGVLPYLEQPTDLTQLAHSAANLNLDMLMPVDNHRTYALTSGQ